MVTSRPEAPSVQRSMANAPTGKATQAMALPVDSGEIKVGD
jgi:hypothetical protein